jgi:metal-dependent amidase/aminoacylase/carboxypeptidase family protein
MGKKSTSASRKAAYTTYKTLNKSVRNRTRKLEKYVKNNPNDLQAKAALDKGLQYARKTPNNYVWTKQSKELAHLLNTLGYKKSGETARKWIQQPYRIPGVRN